MGLFFFRRCGVCFLGYARDRFRLFFSGVKSWKGRLRRLCFLCLLLLSDFWEQSEAILVAGYFELAGLYFEGANSVLRSGFEASVLLDLRTAPKKC